MPGPRLPPVASTGLGLKGTKSKAERRTPMMSLGATWRMAVMISREKVARCSRVSPPYGPLRVKAERKLVAQVAVALLDVDERHARLVGEDGRLHVMLDEILDVVIGHDGIVHRQIELAVEDGMA